MGSWDEQLEFVKLSKLEPVSSWHFKEKVNSRNREELSSAGVKDKMTASIIFLNQGGLSNCACVERLHGVKKGESTIFFFFLRENYFIICAFSLPETLMLESILAKRCMYIRRAMGQIRYDKQSRIIDQRKTKTNPAKIALMEVS